MKTLELKEGLKNYLTVLNGDELTKILRKVNVPFEILPEFTSINQIKEKLNYEITFKNNKIFVDITKNDIFSIKDTNDDLYNKIKSYIKNEEYEKVKVILDYLLKIEN